MSVYKLKRKTGANTTEDVQLDYNTTIANKPTIPTNSDYVDLTTSQTITGTKTFNTSPILKNAIILKAYNSSNSLIDIIGLASSNNMVLGSNALSGNILCYNTFTPPSVQSNNIDLGTSSYKWKNMYLGTCLYAPKINNGSDISIPTTSGTMALTSDLNGYLPKSGGTMTGDIDWSSSNTSAWLKPYLLAFKNANTSASPTYPYTGFYQWGDEWQVNARDSSNTFVHNLLTINNTTKVATFSARPTVNGTNVALTSDGYATVQVYNSEADALAASQADANKICLF